MQEPNVVSFCTHEILKYLHFISVHYSPLALLDHQIFSQLHLTDLLINQVMFYSSKLVYLELCVDLISINIIIEKNGIIMFRN